MSRVKCRIVKRVSIIFLDIVLVTQSRVQTRHKVRRVETGENPSVGGRELGHGIAPLRATVGHGLDNVSPIEREGVTGVILVTDTGDHSD